MRSKNWPKQKKRLEVIRLAVKLGTKSYCSNWERVRRRPSLYVVLARCRSGNWAASPACYLLGDEASSTAIKRWPAVADLAGVEEFSDEITIKFIAGQISTEEFDELERQINDITPATEE